MSAPAWLSYVGVVTGIIGALTGIAGAVMGYVSYRRSTQLKALDLRLELRKSDADIRAILAGLPDLFEKAKGSRIAVANATGRSGARDQWLHDLEADLLSLEDLKTRLPDAPENYTSLSPMELEAKLVEFHSLRSKVNQLSEKHQAALTADDRERERIQANWSRVRSPNA